MQVILTQQDLEAAIAAQSKLIAQLMGMLTDGDLQLTQDEGFEMLDHSLGQLEPRVRKACFAALDAMYPRHSSEG